MPGCTVVFEMHVNYKHDLSGNIQELCVSDVLTQKLHLRKPTRSPRLTCSASATHIKSLLSSEANVSV